MFFKDSIGKTGVLHPKTTSFNTKPGFLAQTRVCGAENTLARYQNPAWATHGRAHVPFALSHNPRFHTQKRQSRLWAKTTQKPTHRGLRVLRISKPKYTVHSTQYTVHSTQYTVHSTQYTVHSTQYTVHSTQYTVHSTQYTVHSTQVHKKLENDTSLRPRATP